MHKEPQNLNYYTHKGQSRAESYIKQNGISKDLPVSVVLSIDMGSKKETPVSIIGIQNEQWKKKCSKI